MTLKATSAPNTFAASSSASGATTTMSAGSRLLSTPESGDSLRQ